MKYVSKFFKHNFSQTIYNTLAWVDYKKRITPTFDAVTSGFSVMLFILSVVIIFNYITNIKQTQLTVPIWVIVTAIIFFFLFGLLIFTFLLYKKLNSHNSNKFLLNEAKKLANLLPKNQILKNLIHKNKYTPNKKNMFKLGNFIKKQKKYYKIVTNQFTNPEIKINLLHQLYLIKTSSDYINMDKIIDINITIEYLRNLEQELIKQKYNLDEDIKLLQDDITDKINQLKKYYKKAEL